MMRDIVFPALRCLALVVGVWALWGPVFGLLTLAGILLAVAVVIC